MGDPPPLCDLACTTKIIIDGDLAGSIFTSTCEGIDKFLAAGGKFKNGQRVLEQLIKAEDEAFKFQRTALEEMGFNGPWPKCLS